MRKELLDYLVWERKELLSKGGGHCQPLEHGLRVVSQSNNDPDVKAFKARLRQRNARNREAAERDRRQQEYRNRNRPLSTKIKIVV